MSYTTKFREVGGGSGALAGTAPNDVGGSLVWSAGAPASSTRSAGGILFNANSYQFLDNGSSAPMRFEVVIPAALSAGRLYVEIQDNGSTNYSLRLLPDGSFDIRRNDITQASGAVTGYPCTLFIENSLTEAGRINAGQIGQAPITYLDASPLTGTRWAFYHESPGFLLTEFEGFLDVGTPPPAFGGDVEIASNGQAVTVAAQVTSSVALLSASAGLFSGAELVASMPLTITGAGPYDLDGLFPGVLPGAYSVAISATNAGGLSSRASTANTTLAPTAMIAEIGAGFSAQRLCAP